MLGKIPFLKRIFRTVFLKSVRRDFRTDAEPMTSVSDSFTESMNFLKMFKNRPFLSILIPVYNTDALVLKKCMDSVLAQVYRKWG